MQKKKNPKVQKNEKNKKKMQKKNTVVAQYLHNIFTIFLQ